MLLNFSKVLIDMCRGDWDYIFYNKFYEILVFVRFKVTSLFVFRYGKFVLFIGFVN